MLCGCETGVHEFAILGESTATALTVKEPNAQDKKGDVIVSGIQDGLPQAEP